MKRIFHLTSVGLVVLVAYAFVFSNSAALRQGSVSQNVHYKEQLYAEQVCFGSSHFANSPAGNELIYVEESGAFQNSEPDSIRNHRSCKTLRLDLPVEVLPTSLAVLGDGKTWSGQPKDFHCSNYDSERPILRI
ncbi:MAG TPA: hypothetical protein VMW01_05195 [Williamwhitmania sp.]|nr:hypothetical protein [Williamwhitmania sp.]